MEWGWEGELLAAVKGGGDEQSRLLPGYGC